MAFGRKKSHNRTEKRNGKTPRHRSGGKFEKLAKTPWIEAIITVFIGLVLLHFQKKDLAEFTWILGAALSFTRYAFVKKLEEEMAPVDKISSIIDLQGELSVAQFREMLRVYLEISEPEFLGVKENIIAEANEKLEKIARQKTSDELETGEYFNWLFSALQNTRSGDQIWAISMTLEIEWIESAVEQTFLDLQLDAVDREVFLERIFVVPHDKVTKLLENKYIKYQFQKTSDKLLLFIVEKEYLEKHDPALLKQLGDGLIGVNDRVVLIDISSPEGYRGRVTMNPAEIKKLRHMYDRLHVYGSPMKSIFTEEGGTTA